LIAVDSGGFRLIPVFRRTRVSVSVARVFGIWGDLEMGHGRFQDPETVMVGPFQDPENAQGHGIHLPPKAVKP